MAGPPVGGPSQSPAPHYTPRHFQPATPLAAHAAASPSPILRHNQVASPAPAPHHPQYVQHPHHQQPPVAIRPIHHAQPQAYVQQPYQHYVGAPMQPAHFQPMQTPAQQNYAYQPVATPSRAPMAPTPGNAAMPQHNAYNPPRPIEVYTLTDAANGAIPEEVRKAYRTDEQGRVLFFAAPSAEHQKLSKESAGLAHSARYLEGLGEWRREREEKRRARDREREEGEKKRKVGAEEEEKRREAEGLEKAAGVLAGYLRGHEEATKRIRKEVGMEGVEGVEA